MANSPQSIKRARQAEKRRRRNQGIGTKFRTMVKRVRADGSGKDEKTTEMFSNMQSATDIAARKGIIHPRKAARLKQRISSLLRKRAEGGAPAKSVKETKVAEKPAEAEVTKAEAPKVEAKKTEAAETDKAEA